MSTNKEKVRIERIHEIDGVRGWAALVVLMFHLTWEVFGAKVPTFRLPYLKFFLDGPLAVYVFFVLSGDALSSPFLALGDRVFIDRLVLKRYFRLSLPIFCSCLLVYILMCAGLNFAPAAAKIVGREDWLGIFLPFAPNFLDTLSYAFKWVFVDHRIETSYNPFLWPMSIEFIGSFFVFTYITMMGRLRWPTRTTLVVYGLALFLSPFYSLFFAGILFAQLRHGGFFKKIRSGNKTALLGLLILLAVVVLDGAFEAIQTQYAPLMNWFARGYPFLNRLGEILVQIHFTPNFRSYFLSVLAVATVAAVYSNSLLVGFFSNRISRFLGGISFPLYIMHFSVIVSFTSWLIIFHFTQEHKTLTALKIISASAVLALIVATLFRPIESKLLKGLDWLVRKCFVSGSENPGKRSPKREH